MMMSITLQNRACRSCFYFTSDSKFSISNGKKITPAIMSSYVSCYVAFMIYEDKNFSEVDYLTYSQLALQ